MAIRRNVTQLGIGKVQVRKICGRDTRNERHIRVRGGRRNFDGLAQLLMHETT